MFEAEFTHEGDRCTLEVLIKSHKEDEMRLTRGAAVFDDSYEYFRRKRG